MVDASVQKQIIERYINGDKAIDIKSDYGVALQTVYNILAKNNVSLRQPNRSHPSNNIAIKTNKSKVKKCPHCKTTKNPNGARYCCMCGKDIRSKEDICVEHLGKALKNCLFLPESMRDETVESIREAISIIHA